MKISDIIKEVKEKYNLENPIQIEYRAIFKVNLKNEDIFVGKAHWEDNKLISDDGDSYSEIVDKYNMSTNKNTGEPLLVVYEHLGTADENILVNK